MKVYVALGSNLGDREQHIVSALDDVASLPGVTGLRGSSLYETEPMGPQNQPDFLNAVCSFEYPESPRLLMQQLQEIEKQHGRQEGGQRWGARPLDLDILLFGNLRIEEPDLRIPHIGLSERSFVLWPLMELDPVLIVPGMGCVRAMQQQCLRFGIKRYENGQIQ